MRDPFTRRLAEGSLKCAKYWQSVLRFGLPFIVLFHSIDYFIFRITAGKVGLRYPWRFAVIMSIPVMFVASTLWWALMREIAAWKRKNQQG